MRILAVSPHLDDVVLSVGALLSALSRGHDVRVLTVFAGDPTVEAETSAWDRRCGFASKVTAIEERRREDTAACSAVGAQCRWLDFDDDGYRGSADVGAAAIASLLAELEWAEVVLAPGAPLIHPDHRWVAEHVMAAGPCRLGLYAESPYWYDPAFHLARGLRSTRRAIYERVAIARPAMHFAPSPLASRRAKRTAIDQYRSQHHGLQRGLILGRALDAVGYGERVGWVRGEPITW